jgi:hypothetical protein
MSDVMLLGVLRMPVPYPVDAMWLHQFVDRARQAADRIEADAAEIERLRAALEGVLPYMEAAENAGLVGHEGCHWPVEAVRLALKA